MVKFCLINNLYKPYSVGGVEKYVEEKAKQLYSIIIEKNRKKNPRLSARYAKEAGMAEEAMQAYSKLIEKAEKNRQFSLKSGLSLPNS